MAKIPAASLRDVRTCFVITPYGLKRDENQKTINFDTTYSRIIFPAVTGLRDEGFNIQCFRAIDIKQAGLIHERMLQRIADADVAVVDLTTANPNVFYELGVRHALADRVTVLLRQKGSRLPFNIAGMSTIEYQSNNEKGVRLAREAIAAYVRNGLTSGATDSLVKTLVPKPGAGGDISQTEVEEYSVPDAPGKRIGIVSGNLRHTNLSAALLERPIDIWMSSENINMQMARPYEASISGLIRYLGAKKDKTGTIVDDVIANELSSMMCGRQVVNPGQIVATSSGELANTHHVKRILHAAAVYGVVGAGFRPIENVEQCITNALAFVDFEGVTAKGKRAANVSEAESILFPVLGTGVARADIIPNARKQVGAALSYLRSRSKFTGFKRVYFLAGSRNHRSALRVVFTELGVKDLARDDDAPTASQKTAAANTRRRSRARKR
jgi:O-acetyl-ADP-ribose deacetylase (regulator of RNase III)